jgi:hypothetical protein
MKGLKVELYRESNMKRKPGTSKPREGNYERRHENTPSYNLTPTT